MINKLLLFSTLCLFSVSICTAQKKSEKETDTTATKLSKELKLAEGGKIDKRAIDPLRPARAAFYSAILPGLGQAYNKKYWKIPLVYAGLGAGLYFYITNNDELNRYRDAFKRRLAGFTDDEFFGDGSEPRLSMDALERAQRQFRRNRDISLLVTIGIYALNIIDANVDAHLLQFNVDENLSVRPHYQYNPNEHSSDLGLTLDFKF